MPLPAGPMIKIARKTRQTRIMPELPGGCALGGGCVLGAPGEVRTSIQYTHYAPYDIQSGIER